jgi:hypothetical protein
MLTSASILPEAEFNMRLLPFVGDGRFSWIDWESSALGEEIRWRMSDRAAAAGLESQQNEVLAFLQRQELIGQLEAEVRSAYAARGAVSSSEAPDESGSGEELAGLELRLADLYREQQETGPRVERILAAQVAHVLESEGFHWGSDVWPPVSFRFNDLPTFLIISPRDRIEMKRGVFLTPDLPEGDRSRLENEIESHLDVSALVDNVGGIGSWPTMVIDTASLRSLLDIISHEWSHTYLFFTPLGSNYDQSRDLTTMNETVASIVGEEVAQLVLEEFYPDMAAPAVQTTRQATENTEETEESFDEAMRRIRLHVDELLAQDRVEEAEAYMDRERLKLVEKGYGLRRLNQAYFAFHGSYATSPSSVDPIGPWMRELRSQSGSLKGFLDAVSRMRSLDDLKKSVGAVESP